MTRLRIALLTSLALLISGPIARAQISNVVVVDFEKAVVESGEGKKSSERFNAALQAKQTELEKKQKDLEDQQKKLQNGARTLSDVAKADLQKDIDRRTTELTRINEDAQRELQSMRDELLRPIAERATAILNALADEKGYVIVVDVSNPENNVIWRNPKSDITDELIKRINAAAANDPAKAEAPKAAAPAVTRPPTTVAPRPAAPATPRTTPPPATPKP